jgi:hypothetical protein
MPKTALPPELRKKMGLVPRGNDENSDIWKAGSGVLAPVGSGKDGQFLKMKSGVPMSYRASRLAQMENGGIRGQANISKPRLIENNNAIALKTRRSSFE